MGRITPRQLYEMMEKETIPCNLCGSTDHLPVFSRERMETDSVICRRCGFLFTNPRPTQEEINKFYRRNYRKSDLNQNNGIKGYEEGSSVYKRAAWLYEIAQKKFDERSIHSPAVLDVGCGSGIVLHLFRTRMPESRLHGIEPSPTYGNYAREKNNADIYAGDIESFAREKADKRGFFDLVTMNHVLEHLYEPVNKLKLLRDFLKPDGLVLLQVPNPFSPDCPSALRMFHIAHVNQFSPQTLRMTFQLAGFSVLEEIPSNPRVTTLLCQKAADFLPVPQIRPISSGQVNRLSASIRGKVMAEMRLKNPFERSLKDRTLHFAFGYFRHRLNDAMLRRLIEGQKTLIVNSAASAFSLAQLPADVKILACDHAAGLCADEKFTRTLDLYLCSKRVLKRKQLKQLFAKIRAQVFLSDDLSFIRRRKDLKRAYACLLYDDGMDDFYINRLFGAAEVQKLRQRNNRPVSPPFRLLQIALHYGAREVYLCGVDFTEKRYAWEGQEPGLRYSDSDENFLKVVSRKFKNVFNLSAQSPVSDYLPFKNVLSIPNPEKIFMS